MKRIKVLMNYKDMQLGRTVNIGEEFEVDDARAMELENHPMGIVEVMDIEPEFKEPVITKKKPGRKPGSKNKRTKK